MGSSNWRFRALVLALVSFGSFVALEAARPEVAHAAASPVGGVALGGTLLGLAAVVFASSVVASAACCAVTRGWRRALPVIVNSLTILWLYLQD